MQVKQPRIPSEASPTRMQALARLPVFLALDGKRAVLAGGSPAAAWKAELLSACGAHVEVYAIDPCDELLQLAADPPRGTIAIDRHDWTAEDLKGAVVAVGAFEDDEGAARFSSAARAVGVPVNVIDKPAFCDFSFGAIVNRSPLCDRNFYRRRCSRVCASSPCQARGVATQRFYRLGGCRFTLAQRGKGIWAFVFRTPQVLAIVHRAGSLQSGA